MQLKHFLLCCIFIIYNVEICDASCDDTTSNLTTFIFTLNSSSLLEYLDFQALCFSSHIDIKLDRCALTDIGYLGGVGLFDFNGHAYEDDMCRSENHRDQINIQLQGNMSDCAFKVTETASGMLYEFELKNINNYTGGFFSRLPTLNIHFSCKFELAHEFSFQSDLTLVPDDKVIDISSDTINNIPNEVFGSSFLLYNDSSFEYSYSINDTLTIQVPEYVYFEVSTEAGPSYVIQGQKCWATPTSDSNDDTNYIIVEYGCAGVDPLFSDANIIFTNYNSTKFQVGFRSFSWSDGETGLYLHCNIDLCDTNALSTCYDDPCTTSLRKRREATQRRMGRHMFTYSGIRLKTEENNCSNGNGGCSHECINSADGVQCKCPKHFDLLEDKKTCTEWTSDFLAEKLGKEINLAVHGDVERISSKSPVVMRGITLFGLCFIIITLTVFLIIHHHHRWKKKITNTI